MFLIKKAIKKITPDFILNIYHFKLALLAAIWYGFPSRKLKVIGVTGTNGKSTTAAMLAAIFKEAGYRVALSSSINFEIAGDISKNTLSNSMPGRFAIQRLLAEAVKAKCDYAFIEVTSEGIKQHRHRFIKFIGAIFTNLTPEHIESHGNFENYRNAKLNLFKTAKGFHVISLDDENTKYFLDVPAQKRFCYTVKNAALPQGISATLVKAGDIISKKQGVGFLVNGMDFFVAIPGQFNVSNALAAICAAFLQGISLAVCERALRNFSALPGRMEKVHDLPQVFVDYAFTPNALEQVYKDLTSRKSASGKLICVLGACGGGRDKWKRPVLGEIVASYCGQIILTDEDPFDEDPQTILDMIKGGVVKKGFSAINLHEVLDRREAISRALALAGPDDIVILTGKGSESWIRLKDGKKIAWDEKTIVQELAKKLRLGQ